MANALRVISAADVRGLVKMRDAIEAVRHAFIEVPPAASNSGEEPPMSATSKCYQMLLASCA